jgi:hypothetical protein
VETQNKPGLFIGVYGPAKVGKTFAALHLAGSNGFFVAQNNAVLAAHTVFGQDLTDRLRYANTAGDAVGIMAALPAGISCVVVDDFSLMMDRTVDKLEGEKKGNVGKFWRGVKEACFNIAHMARRLNAKGIHVVVNMHEQPPRVSSGKPIRGGPRLIGQLPEQFAAELDIILKVEYESTAKPWPYVARTISRDFIAGDRLSVFVDGAPFNLAEGFRQAGYDIPYSDFVVTCLTLAEIDKTADQIVETFSRFPERREALVQELLQAGVDNRAVLLLLQDGVHRQSLSVGWIDGLLQSLISVDEIDSEEDW